MLIIKYYTRLQYCLTRLQEDKWLLLYNNFAINYLQKKKRKLEKTLQLIALLQLYIEIYSYQTSILNCLLFRKCIIIMIWILLLFKVIHIAINDMIHRQWCKPQCYRTPNHYARQFLKHLTDILLHKTYRNKEKSLSINIQLIYDERHNDTHFIYLNL